MWRLLRMWTVIAFVFGADTWSRQHLIEFCPYLSSKKCLYLMLALWHGNLDMSIKGRVSKLSKFIIRLFLVKIQIFFAFANYFCQSILSRTSNEILHKHMIGEISIHFTRYLICDVDTPHHGGIPANPRLMDVRMHNGPSSSGSTRKRHTKHLSPLTFSHKIFATLTVTKNTNDFLGC